MIDIRSAWIAGAPVRVICETAKISMKELHERKEALGLSDRVYEPQHSAPGSFPIGDDPISRTIAHMRSEALRHRLPEKDVLFCWLKGHTVSAVLAHAEARGFKISRTN